MTKSQQRIVVVPDVHLPHHDEHALSVALQILKAHKPDIVVFIGDFLDCEPLSHWLRDKKRLVEGLRMWEDFKLGNDILDQIEEVCKRWVFIEGNHEDWIRQYIDEHPEVEGFFELDKGLEFEKRRKRGVRITHLKYGQTHKIGKAYFTHGTYTCMHHAKKHVDEYGRSIIYGHLHTIQQYVKVSPVDVEDKHLGLCIGCLCSKNPEYMRNKPNGWVHAITTGYIRRDGSFNISPTIIVNGKATFNGKTYVSKKK